MNMFPKKQNEMDSDYERFINAWGTKSQIIKTMGEMHELGVILCREMISFEILERDGIRILSNPSEYHEYCQTPPSIRDIIDEIADVYLMIDQLSYIFGREQIKEIIAQKLERVEKRVEEVEV